jgi:hypothetical protein
VRRGHLAAGLPGARRRRRTPSNRTQRRIGQLRRFWQLWRSAQISGVCRDR